MAELETIKNIESTRKETSKSLPPKLLDATQWTLWKLRMKLHLQSAGVWDIVDDAREVPTADDTPEVQRTYRKDKSKAHNDLLRALDLSMKNLPLLSTQSVKSGSVSKNFAKSLQELSSSASREKSKD